MTPKFIQIAACVDEAVVDSLYALDEAGGVWTYDYNTQMWVPIPSRRSETP